MMIFGVCFVLYLIKLSAGKGIYLSSTKCTRNFCASYPRSVTIHQSAHFTVKARDTNSTVQFNQSLDSGEKESRLFQKELSP